MGKWIFVLLMMAPVCANAATVDLDFAIADVRANCGGISGALNHMKTMAGVNTAVTGVGTVAGGVALGTGLAKVGVDKKADELENLLAQLQAAAARQNTDELTVIPVDAAGTVVVLDGATTAMPVSNSDDAAKQKEAEEKLDKLTAKSKSLGNWRTGTLAVNTATNVAGTAIAATNRVKGDLLDQIDQCRAAVDKLSNTYMQARMEADVSAGLLSRAQQIIAECGAWSTVDLSSINSKAKGAAISSGIGAGVGAAGVVTSALANTDKVRDENVKEKNLNTASNILAGGATVASGVATVFNATQIGAIKKASVVAAACEGALR